VVVEFPPGARPLLPTGTPVTCVDNGMPTVLITAPTGFLDVESSLGTTPDGLPAARRTAMVRTARKLFDGVVFPRSAEIVAEAVTASVR
jgi:4-oxalomesaconate tautomerase